MKESFAQPKRQAAVATAVMLVTLAILAALVYTGQHQLRSAIRDQIASQHAHLLHALIHKQLAQDDLASLYPEANAADQFTSLLLAAELPELTGLLATRLFEPDGTLLVAFPETATQKPLQPDVVHRLASGQPLAQFHPNEPLENQFWLVDTNSFASERTAPLLELLIPLRNERDGPVVGLAQYVLDGESMAAEFARLDQSLLRQGSFAFLAAGSIILLILALAFRHLQRANQLLSDQAKRLLQANRDLALAAKTNALGSVTAHLIHGLRSPLSGLNYYIQNSRAGANGDTEVWKQAAACTQQMQSMVTDVVRLLQEQSHQVHYELSLQELLQLLRPRLQPLADAKNVHLTFSQHAQATLSNRHANLILLILENLLHNAIQACPPGRSTELHLRQSAQLILFDVVDEGPGLPDHVRQELFRPQRSQKDGNSGIGLALSYQLAQNLGGEIELVRTSASGSCFRLSIPLSALEEPALDRPQHSPTEFAAIGSDEK